MHQFQGSEKEIIIYDAVDCYRMRYPGVLLTGIRNDAANRLFNVALSRTRGKFVLIANRDYFYKKKLSKKLMFEKYLSYTKQQNKVLNVNEALDEMMPQDEEKLLVYSEDLESSWQVFIDDIANSTETIKIDVPGVLYDDEEKIKEFMDLLEERNDNGVVIAIRNDENLTLPKRIRRYVVKEGYVTNPVTIIDDSILWYGQPLCNADFMTEGYFLSTEYNPCFRVVGKYIIRSIKSLLEM